MHLDMQITQFSSRQQKHNIAKPAGDADSTPLKNIIEEAKALKESDYTPESWANVQTNLKSEKTCLQILQTVTEWR